MCSLGLRLKANLCTLRGSYKHAVNVLQSALDHLAYYTGEIRARAVTAYHTGVCAVSDEVDIPCALAYYLSKLNTLVGSAERMIDIRIVFRRV